MRRTLIVIAGILVPFRAHHVLSGRHHHHLRTSVAVLKALACGQRFPLLNLLGPTLRFFFGRDARLVRALPLQARNRLVQLPDGWRLRDQAAQLVDVPPRLGQVPFLQRASRPRLVLLEHSLQSCYRLEVRRVTRENLQVALHRRPADAGRQPVCHEVLLAQREERFDLGGHRLLNRFRVGCASVSRHVLASPLYRPSGYRSRYHITLFLS